MINESMDGLFNRIIETNDRLKPHWRKWSVEIYGIGLSKEVGEICDAISVWVGGGSKTKKPLTAQEVCEELFDLFVYSTLFNERMGLSLADVIAIWRLKLDVVEKRLLEKWKE